MTDDKGTRRIWVGAAVAVLAAGVLTRELLRSGTVGGDFLNHWYGQVGLTAIAVTMAATGLFFLNRAYRSPRPAPAPTPPHHPDRANPS